MACYARQDIVQEERYFRENRKAYANKQKRGLLEMERYIPDIYDFIPTIIIKRFKCYQTLYFLYLCFR